MIKKPEFSQKTKDRLSKLKGRLREEFLSAQTGLLAGLALPLIATDYLAINIVIGISAFTILNRFDIMPRTTGLLVGLATAFGVNIYQDLDRYGIIDHIQEQIKQSQEPEGIMVKNEADRPLPTFTIPKTTIV